MKHTHNNGKKVISLLMAFILLIGMISVIPGIELEESDPAAITMLSGTTGAIRVNHNDPLVNSADHTLYAKWQPIEPTPTPPPTERIITFDPQGGMWFAPESSTNSITRPLSPTATSFETVMHFDNSAVLGPHQNPPIRTHYIFAGWSLTPTGGTRQFHDTVITPGDTNITLYAQWQPLNRIIMFNPQGGTWTGIDWFPDSHSSWNLPNDGGWVNGGLGDAPILRSMHQSATSFASVIDSDNVTLLNFHQNAPSRFGFEFAGWFSTLVGGPRVNHDTAVPSGTGMIVLHAQWIPLTRDVIFSPTGGTWAAPAGGTGNITRTMHQIAPIFDDVIDTNNTTLLNPTQNAPYRVGYEFLGWFLAPEAGGTRLEHDTDTVPIGSSAITLYARWAPLPSSTSERTIVFNPVGGTWVAPAGGTGDVIRTMPQSETSLATVIDIHDDITILNPVQNIPTRTGYVFSDWLVHLPTHGTFPLQEMRWSGGWMSYIDPGAYTITLDAHWTPLTRQVIFNPQGGTWVSGGTGSGSITGTMNQSATSFADLISLNDNIFVHSSSPSIVSRAGYTFLGWFSEPTGGTRQHNNTTVAPGDSTITLYAQWIPTASTNERVVIFNPQGGTWAAPEASTENIHRTMASSATSFATVMNADNAALLNAPQNAPTRTGYIFAGWFLTANPAPVGTRQNHNTDVTPSTNTITLHAHWAYANTREVVFNPQGGTWAGGLGTVNLTRAINQNATSLVTVLDVNNSTILNPGLVVAPNQNAPIRTGYIFTGWFSEPTGGTRQLHNTTITPSSGTITLYAQWISASDRTVVFNPQGGTWAAPAGGIASVSRLMPAGEISFSAIMSGDGLLNPAQAIPTRAGYIFTGWFLTPTGEGTRQFGSSPVVQGESTITLYAQWAPPTRAVLFLLEGGVWQSEGAVSNHPVSLPMRQDATSFATVISTDNATLLNPISLLSPISYFPMRTGYIFEGWFPTPTGGSRVNHSTTVMPGDSFIILHAQWTPVTGFGIDNISVVTGASITITSAITTSAGITVTFDPQGGEWTAPASGTAGIIRNLPYGATNYESVMNPDNRALLNSTQPEPMKTGYIFLGWFATPAPTPEPSPTPDPTPTPPPTTEPEPEPEPNPSPRPTPIPTPSPTPTPVPHPSPTPYPPDTADPTFPPLPPPPTSTLPESTPEGETNTPPIEPVQPTQPIPSAPGNSLAEYDGMWIEFDEMGVPLGTWVWDDEEEIWIFDDTNIPLGALAPAITALPAAMMPQTGRNSIIPLLAAGFGVSTLILLLAVFAIFKRKR